MPTAQTHRRMPKVLNKALCVYTEKDNHKYAKTTGKKLFGSHSAYINALISKDRGVKPKLGQWKTEGEAKKLRLATAKKAALSKARKTTPKKTAVKKARKK